MMIFLEEKCGKLQGKIDKAFNEKLYVGSYITWKGSE